LYGEFENEKKKDNFFWPSGAGIWTPDFQWISRPWFEFEGDKIKPRQPSKRDRTLTLLLNHQHWDFLRTVSSIDLISLKIQILGGKVLFKNLGFESQWGRVKFFAIFLFFFTFFILSIKNWILKHILPFLYINGLHRNKIKFVQYTYFYWYLIGKRR